MFDDIGLERALANVIYLVILFIAIVGGLIFWKFKKRGWAFWWLSVMASIFAYLYFLGGYGGLDNMAQAIGTIGWPIINLAWLADLVRGEWRARKAKGRK